MKLSEIQLVSEIQALFAENNEYDAIKADIAERGIQEAVIINTKNELLCGYTRLSIAEELGIEEIPHRVVDITECDAMIEYALLDNMRRRQLTDLQLVEYGMKLEKLYEGRVGNPQLRTDCPELEKGRTSFNCTYVDWKPIETHTTQGIRAIHPTSSMSSSAKRTGHRRLFCCCLTIVMVQ